MHSLHIDAFFQYCLGHQHSYYTERPSNEQELQRDVRDGVPRDEDFALRALFPHWKPKKGRKRAEDKDSQSSNPKRQQLNSPKEDMQGTDDHSSNGLAQSDSAAPWSAFQEIDNDNWGRSPAPSSAVTPSIGGSFGVQSLLKRDVGLQWRNAGSGTTPPLQYPVSAVTPRSQEIQPSAGNGNEPRSAITASAAERIHQKQQPGITPTPTWGTLGENAPFYAIKNVPSAIQQTNNGLFTRFSAYPRGVHVTTPKGKTESPSIERPPKNGTVLNTLRASRSSGYEQKPCSKPTKLQLTVPQTSGEPPRLATPPVVLVNGQKDSGPSSAVASVQNKSSFDMSASPNSKENRKDMCTVGFTLDDVVQLFASQVYSGRLMNNTTPLKMDEARLISQKATEQLKSQCRPGLAPGAVAVYCATLLGVGHNLGIGGQIPGKVGVRACQKPPSAESREADSARRASKTPAKSERCHAISYDLFPSSSNITVSVTIQSPFPSRTQQQTDTGNNTDSITKQMNPEDDDISDDTNFDESTSPGAWKQKYLNLKKQVRKKERALVDYKKRILEVVMDDTR